MAGEVRRVLDDGARRALVLGGDCTVGVGAVAGVAHRGRVGLVYLDLHADMNVPDATEDGTLDWMGVAHLLALDGTRSELRDVGLRTPLLQGKDLVLVGFDPDYATAFELAAIAEQDVTVVTVADLAADPKGAARRALAALADCDVLSVHLDVDLVDFLELPLSENTERDGGVTLADRARRAARPGRPRPHRDRHADRAQPGPRRGGRLDAGALRRRRGRRARAEELPLAQVVPLVVVLLGAALDA